MLEDGTEVYNPDLGTDYIVSYIENVTLELTTATGVTIMTDTDVKEATDESLEILVGNTNRPETKAFLKNLRPNEYGYGVVGNKLVIAGWAEYTSAMAIDAFLAEYEQYLVDADGGLKNLVMSDGVTKSFVYDSWNVNVPMFQGGELMGVLDGLYKSYYMCYENATLEGFREYRTQIEAAGFSLWQENQVGESVYAATYYDSKVVLHAYYLPSDNTVRISVEHTRSTELPPLRTPARTAAKR